jgi:hypothetical protein
VQGRYLCHTLNYVICPRATLEELSSKIQAPPIQPQDPPSLSI